MFITTETSEIKTPGLSRAEGSVLILMRVSHSQIVEAADDMLFKCRVRTLESHTPNPDPVTETHDAPVATNTDEKLLTAICMGTYTTEAFT
jgi:hypothetical protein